MLAPCADSHVANVGVGRPQGVPLDRFIFRIKQKIIRNYAKPRRALTRTSLINHSSGSPLHSVPPSAARRYVDSAQLRRSTKKMDQTIVQSLYDSALRSDFGWRHKAAQLYTIGVRTLEKAAEAREDAKHIFEDVKHKSRSHELSQEEIKIYEESQLFNVGIFLIALSVENLLKAIWVARNHIKINQISNIRKDLKQLADHRLPIIANHAGVSLKPQERKLLEELTDYILWFGRYPVPLSKNTYSNFLSSGGPGKYFLNGQSIFDIDMAVPQELEKFTSRLIDELQSIPDCSK